MRLLANAAPSLLRGAEITVAASLLGIVLGLMVGTALAVARQTGGAFVRSFASIYVSFARGTPLFVQIFVVFFVLPAIGLNIPKFFAGVIALSLNSGAYISEMIRGGLSAIPRGQIEAAKALGLRRRITWHRIVLPQVFYLILPPLAVEFISLVKASSLLSVIGVIELTRTAQEIVAATFQPVPIWVATGVIYFVTSFALGAVTRRLERKTVVFRSH